MAARKRCRRRAKRRSPGKCLLKQTRQAYHDRSRSASKQNRRQIGPRRFVVESHRHQRQRLHDLKPAPEAPETIQHCGWGQECPVLEKPPLRQSKPSNLRSSRQPRARIGPSKRHTPSRAHRARRQTPHHAESNPASRLNVRNRELSNTSRCTLEGLRPLQAESNTLAAFS